MPATKTTTETPKADTAPVIDAELNELLEVIEADPTRRTLPDIEEHGDVITARAAADDMRQKKEAVAADITAAETRMNVKPGASRNLDAIAPRLIAEGRATDDDLEAVGKLWVRLKRLTDAEEMALAALHKARERARAELSPLAANVRFIPACRATSAALVELLRCVRAEMDSSEELRAGGFNRPQGSGVPADGIADIWSNPIVAGMIRNGLIDREAVKLAVPTLNGI